MQRNKTFDLIQKERCQIIFNFLQNKLSSNSEHLFLKCLISCKIMWRFPNHLSVQ